MKVHAGTQWLTLISTINLIISTMTVIAQQELMVNEVDFAELCKGTNVTLTWTDNFGSKVPFGRQWFYVNSRNESTQFMSFMFYESQPTISEQFRAKVVYSAQTSITLLSLSEEDAGKYSRNVLFRGDASFVSEAIDISITDCISGSPDLSTDALPTISADFVCNGNTIAKDSAHFTRGSSFQFRIHGIISNTATVKVAMETSTYSESRVFQRDDVSGAGDHLSLDLSSLLVNFEDGDAVNVQVTVSNASFAIIVHLQPVTKRWYLALVGFACVCVLLAFFACCLIILWKKNRRWRDSEKQDLENKTIVDGSSAGESKIKKSSNVTESSQEVSRNLASKTGQKNMKTKAQRKWRLEIHPISQKIKAVIEKEQRTYDNG